MNATTDHDFDRMVYLSLADEFDPMGADPNAPEPTIDDFDPIYVDAARAFASRLQIPLPWELRSMDNALEYVRLADAKGTDR